MFATIDLTGATGAIDTLSGALVTALGTVLVSALAVAAVVYGSRVLWRFFKSLGK